MNDKLLPSEKHGHSGHPLRPVQALSPVRSDDLFDVLVAIVNTAQRCPDRCMVDVCNDNFLVHGIHLQARLVPGNEDWPIKIESTSNKEVSIER